VDIDLVDRAFLSEVEHFVRRIGEVTGECGEATGKFVARNDADLAGCVHRVSNR